MERLVWHIIDGLRPEWRVHVIGPTGCGTYLPSDIDTTEVPARPLWRFLMRTKVAALHKAFHIRPKLVIAGSGLTAPFAWIVARLAGARCIVYLHGLDVEAQHPIYRLLWRPFFKHFDRVLVNSRFTRRLALEVGVPESRIITLNPGVTLPNSTHAAKLRKEFRERYKLGTAPLMLYVGRITVRKGLVDFIKYSLPNIIAKTPAAKLIIIGDDPSDSLLGTTGERTRIEENLQANDLTDHVLFLGERAQNDPELDSAYFAADVSIFPVKARPHDNEGFGMVAIEAAAHGLHTVAFDVGGVSDAIADGVSGKLIPPGQYEQFSRAVHEYLVATPKTDTDIAQEILAFVYNFSWDVFGKKLRGLSRFATKQNDIHDAKF